MSDRPKEGVYLDAALGVIGEQVEERIDEIVRRRRVRARVGVVALGALTLASGSVAAVAVTASLQSSRPAPEATASASTAQVRCIDGEDLTATPFFTVTFRIPAGAGVDEERLCVEARQQLATDAAALGRATPEELVASAEERLLDVSDTDEIAVEEASYGVLPNARDTGGDGAAVCVDGATTTILLGASAHAVGGLWTACPKAAG